MCHVMAGLDMSNLAAMFGGGAGLGGLAAGAPPVQDPETAYASQLTQLQAGETAHTVSFTVNDNPVVGIKLGYIRSHM